MRSQTIVYHREDRVDLREYPIKQMPVGTWITFHDLDPDVTDEEIQKMIADRTGVVIPLEGIQLKAFTGNKTGALVSFGKEAINALVAWALSEDELHGRKVHITTKPQRKAQW